MSTKNNPGIFDAYAAAHPDEPIYVLLGRDPQAADLVRLWAIGRDFLEGADDPQIEAAYECAAAMRAWCTRHAKESPVDALTLLPFEALASELRRRGAIVTTAGSDDDDEFGDSPDLDS